MMKAATTLERPGKTPYDFMDPLVKVGSSDVVA
jgi:hypothetical protein